MTSVEIKTPDGKTDGSVDLPAEIFDVQANIALMHQVVVAQQAAARQGTHSTKTRGEVSGGGKKPYRQKGTGRARQGSTRAPQFAGGGVVHGPQPRDYAQRTPKKMKAAALRGALSDRARAGQVHVVSGLVDGEKPSTKDARKVLESVTEAKNLLVVLTRDDETSWLSVRNLPNVHVIVRRPAEHLRRAGQRRRGLHEGRLAGVPRGPGPGPLGQGRRTLQRGRRGGGQVIPDPRDVLLAPVISEKSYGLLEENKYTFVVAPHANKTEIKIAVEKVFGVQVVSVNTLNRQGKRKRTRTGYGKRKDTKRAIVTLPPRASRSRSSAVRP